MDPADPIAKHLQAASASAPPPDRCTAEYVRAEFDRAANSFDTRLASLDYSLPGYVAPIFSECFARDPGGDLHILDAGCGTGLCAPALSPWKYRLVGVDLSPEMIRIAAAGGHYDQLCCEDLVDYLVEHTNTYDAIVSMDVLLYFGGLGEVLTAACRALKPRGLIIFSLEQTRDAEDFVLQNNGRYAHAYKYVEQAVIDAELEAVVMRSVILRSARPRFQVSAQSSWPCHSLRTSIPPRPVASARSSSMRSPSGTRSSTAR